jgi:hypothetical protein
MIIKVRHIAKVKNGVYIGREMKNRGIPGSPLANPFKINRFNPRKDAVLKYMESLPLKLAQTGSPAANEFIKLMEQLKEREKLTLLCWCHPLLCHGEAIAQAMRAVMWAEGYKIKIDPDRKIPNGP